MAQRRRVRRSRGVSRAVWWGSEGWRLPLAEHGGRLLPRARPEGRRAATPADAKGLLKSAIRDDDPVIFFEPKRLPPRTRARRRADDLTPLGVARVDRAGGALTIVTYGIGLHVAREGRRDARRRRHRGRDRDLRTLVPMDKEASRVGPEDQSPSRPARGEQDDGVRRGGCCVRRRRAVLRPRRRSSGSRPTTATCRTTAPRRRRSSRCRPTSSPQRALVGLIMLAWADPPCGTSIW